MFQLPLCSLECTILTGMHNSPGSQRKKISHFGMWTIWKALKHINSRLTNNLNKPLTTGRPFSVIRVHETSIFAVCSFKCKRSDSASDVCRSVGWCSSGHPTPGRGGGGGGLLIQTIVSGTRLSTRNKNTHTNIMGINHKQSLLFFGPRGRT